MARKQAIQTTLEFTQSDVDALAKPPSTLSQLNIAFWFLTKIGNAERAKVLLDIAVDAQYKLSQLTIKENS